jgi:hypothetical protein
MDANGDGVLTIDELQKGYFEYMGEMALFSGADVAEILT